MVVRKGDSCPVVEDGKVCGKPVQASEMCSMHYARQRKYGDALHRTRPYVRQGDKCMAPEGCDEKPKYNNLCGKHVTRQIAHGTTMDPRERKFWAQVGKRGPDECWPWTGHCQKNGYGQFGTKGERLAHRVAYGYMIGPIPKGLVLDHLCHTRDPRCADTDQCPHRRCCNPEHLEPVTRRENIARGRGGDSWGFIHHPAVMKPKAEKPTICTKCGRTDKPVYKSGLCRPCYRKWLKDPDVERPSQQTPEQRFWAKVEKTGSCWLWTAGINRLTGYGRFALRHGVMMDAHRFSYELAHGPIPEKHDVHHTCHVRHCVNPAHLEAVTRSENLRMRKYRRDPAA